jgi:hypothetical protein
LDQPVPTWQGEHVTLLLAVPAVDTPSPATHVAHKAQASVEILLALVPALNVSEAHASHSRSLLAVAAVLVNVPAAQAALVGSHTSSLYVSLKVVPSALQATHWRSVTVVPSVVLPSPMPHLDHGVQLSVSVMLVLAFAFQVPSPHSRHTRSVDAVIAACV